MTQVSVDLAPETESARRKLSLQIEADARARSRDWSERTSMLLTMREETPHRVDADWTEDVSLASQRLVLATADIEQRCYANELASEKIRAGLLDLGRNLRRSSSFGR